MELSDNQKMFLRTNFDKLLNEAFKVEKKAQGLNTDEDIQALRVRISEYFFYVFDHILHLHKEDKVDDASSEKCFADLREDFLLSKEIQDLHKCMRPEILLSDPNFPKIKEIVDKNQYQEDIYTYLKKLAEQQSVQPNDSFLASSALDPRWKSFSELENKKKENHPNPNGMSFLTKLGLFALATTVSVLVIKNNNKTFRLE